MTTEEPITPLPNRGRRFAILFAYIALACVVLLTAHWSGLVFAFVVVLEILLLGGAVPLWLVMQMLAKRETRAVVQAKVGNPLAALDEAETGTGGEGKGSTFVQGSQPTQTSDSGPSPSPRPEPRPDPFKVKVAWTRTQKLEGYLPVESVKVVEQTDTGVEVVKEGA